MSKALWKGNLSLGLVNIPVRLYPETRARKPALGLVDRRDLSPLGVSRINKKTGELVPSSEIARAVTLPGGERMIVPEEILEDASGIGSHAVRIVGFTPIGEISPALYETPYFLEPSPEGEKAYAILLEALGRSRKAAIARTTLVHREKIAVLWTDHSLLLMSLLRWPGELRRPGRLSRDLPAPEVVGILPDEIEAAERLVEAMTLPWDPRAFRDDSGDKLRAWVEHRAEARAARVREVPAPTPSALILAFLERSVRTAQEQKTSRPTRTA